MESLVVVVVVSLVKSRGFRRGRIHIASGTGWGTFEIVRLRHASPLRRLSAAVQVLRCPGTPCCGLRLPKPMLFLAFLACFAAPPRPLFLLEL